MESEENNLLEKTKKIQTNQFFIKDSYIDILYNDIWRQGYIIDQKSNNKFDIIFITAKKNKRINDYSSRTFSFFGENFCPTDVNIRVQCLNNKLNNMKPKEVLELFYSKINQIKLNITNLSNTSKDTNNNNQNEYNGYYTFQFLSGFLIDCFIYISSELVSEKKEEALEHLILATLDTIIYVFQFVKNNLARLKSAMNYRKLLVISQPHAILASFEHILNNLIHLVAYDFKVNDQILEKIKMITNLCYDALKNAKTTYDIPIHLLVNMIYYLTCEDTIVKMINKFDKTLVYQIFSKTIDNLKENEIKNIKKISQIKEHSKLVVKKLFNKENVKLINQCYFSFILNCFKCNILERKMSALNAITEMINEEKSEFNDQLYDFFIVKNKILNIFIEESIHDEVIKRSNELFKYLASFDKLNEDIIEKLVQAQDNNELLKNILIEVVSELPVNKKNALFNRLTSQLNYDENASDIDYLSKLTEACFNINSYSFQLFRKINRKDNNKENKKEEGKTNKNSQTQKATKEHKKLNLENFFSCGFNGLNIIFNYIIKDFNEQKPYDKNNVNKAIDAFSHIINKIQNLESQDIYDYVDRLLYNIENNKKNNSVVQSLLLIKKLITCFDDPEAEEKLLKILDNKYHIISLIINDLIRYINQILKTKDTIQKNKIYEGIYPHYMNIEQRLNLIFDFVKGDDYIEGLDINSKDHLEKMYNIFKNSRLHAELLQFFGILTGNMEYINKEALNDFFKNILLNKNEFDIDHFSEKESLTLIIRTFHTINLNCHSLYRNSKKYYRVKSKEIQGLDMLFQILINNKNAKIQIKICELLSNLCLNLYDYKQEFSSQYWVFYMNKITNILEILHKNKNLEGMSGIIKLIDIIYSSSCNFGGKIPKKEDTHQASDPFSLYHFCCPDRKDKLYKLKVGEKDKILDMRWKLGYYYDIHINNVVFVDIKGNLYSFKDEEKNFYDIFPPKIYLPEGKENVLVNVRIIPDQLLQMKNNPKNLIEENTRIFNILIENLYSDIPSDCEMKQKMWNILIKLPKKWYINNNIKCLVEKTNNSSSNNTNNNLDEKIKKNFNLKEIYILTYTLLCMKEYINKNRQNINDYSYIDYFVNTNHGDQLIYNILLDVKLIPSKSKLIEYECLDLIIDILRVIEKSKKANNTDDNIIKKIGKDVLFNKITQLIIDVMKTNFSYLHTNSYYNNSDIIDSVDDNDKDNYITRKIDKLIFSLLDNIINFINQITNDNSTNNNTPKNNNSYLSFLFTNINLFKELFINDYMECEKDELKKTLSSYLSNHLFRPEEQKTIKKYFEIMISIEVFNDLVEKDHDGSYFHELSSMMKKFNKKNKDQNQNSIDTDKKHIEQFKQIIDLILNYIQKKCNTSNTKEDSSSTSDFFEDSKIEGILTFLKGILNLSPNELVSYLFSKVDICELFLRKCILRKCSQNPLDTKIMLCTTSLSQETTFKLIIFILRNISDEKNELSMQIWNEINKYHQIGFWKTHKNKDWTLEPKEIYKGKYIGLKNMTATCYMNSILQQIFMIPMLRETLLSITNTKKDSVLYQLQLLFASLKAYEYKFYDPRPFVEKSGLNFYEQMDANEYYGQLIDKIENDIKLLYNKETKNINKDKNYPYKDLFKVFFGIKVLDELKFVDCGHKRYNEFYYNNIQLEIKGFNNIGNSLKNYCKTEVMDGDNKINCEVCNTKRTCHKRQIFKSLPNILVIALKRFEFDYDTMLKYKLNDYFKFPFELDMKNYLIENHTEKNTQYELSGITIHYGVSDFGHYYDLIKGPDGKWYKFNDTSVKEFSEYLIAEEAYGEKDIDDEINKEYESKENDKNNAYILIYKKKNFDNEPIEKIYSNYKSELALPPYDRMSNINDEFKSIINYEMFKYWTLENITNKIYQSFVIDLLKIDLVKNLNLKIEKCHSEFFKELREEEYLPYKSQSSSNNENQYQYQNQKQKSINSSSIFLYGLRYYFNVMLRTFSKDKKNLTTFTDIIRCYIESDSNKAQYLLEEFSDNDAINEYLVFCPISDSIKFSSEIIITSFKKFYYDDEKGEKILLIQFINRLLLFIYDTIKEISLEHVNNIFYQIIQIGPMFIQYLKEKKLEVWINNYIKENNEEEEEVENKDKDNISEKAFPPLKTNHYILTERINLFDISKVENKSSNKDKDDLISNAYLKKLKENYVNNIILMKNLEKLFNQKKE